MVEEAEKLGSGIGRVPVGSGGRALEFTRPFSAVDGNVMVRFLLGLVCIRSVCD
jgi:hypothetical protein